MHWTPKSAALFGGLLLAAPCAADIGPKPIRDIGAVDEPGSFRLVANVVSVTLDTRQATVDAWFHLVSTETYRIWDKGRIVWGWPLPGDLPDPIQLRFALRVHFLGHKRNWPERDSFELMLEDAAAVPCPPAGNAWAEFDRRFGIPWALQQYELLGISRWAVLEQGFLLYMPGPWLSVRLHVRYMQPYARVPGQADLRDFVYVLRTGALWEGPIDRLRITVKAKHGVKIVDSTWPLAEGVCDSLTVEPADDLRLRLRLPR
ncbi:hypothetical protein FJ251_14215 [bacterium]|nr:hypothetical protein [bacterium]